MHVAAVGLDPGEDVGGRQFRASGARPRRPALRGAASLSPQERQTTRHAAEGLTNREIAEAMFLTRPTVEMHLSSAYRKLDIFRREELGAALALGAAAEFAA